jgi:sugar phosphate isomerase/epimerase
VNPIGLCSMSFPDESVEAVIEICKRNKVEALEWSGRDYHLPPGTPEARVRQVAAICNDAGISLPSYGSYHGVYNDDPADFAAQLDVAEALGCGVIRVWASHWGDPGELSEMSTEQVDQLVERTVKIAEMGQRRGIKVAFEFHTHTPTCGADEVLRVLDQAGHANMYTYFQMLELGRSSVEQNLEELCRVFSRLAFVHCHWFEDEENTNYMRQGERRWRPLLEQLDTLGYEGPLYLEYYKDYTEEQFADDLAFLREELDRLME